MKLISWNLNGIRAVLKKNLLEFISKEGADIFCFQETKAREDQVDLNNYPELSDYNSYWNSSVKLGYSGTLILTRVEPISVKKGIGVAEHDQEGRVLTTEFKDFFLVNVYTPNSGDGLRRLTYRQLWDVAFLDYLGKLRAVKEVLVCGDLNVAHKEIDIARPNANRKNAGFTDEERAGFDKIIESGMVDTFREFDKSSDKYSWWSYRTRAREKNIGWRIDYWLASKSISSSVKRSYILDDVYGSDHCPVGIEI